MDGYAVDPARLSDCDADLVETSVEARSGLVRLVAMATPVLTTAWQGEAAAAFRLGWQQWLEGAHAMLGALEELAGAVGGSGSAYGTAEAAVVGAVERAGT